MNVLIIDDNSDITDSIEAFLIAKNISCKVINDGKEGLAEIQKPSYDVVFLDLAMPGYNGHDILLELRKQNIKDKSIILLTASNIECHELNYFKDMGVKEILIKPVSLAKLESTAKQIFNTAS